MIVKGRNVQVNMQRRHMEFIAATINTIEDKEERNKVAILFADAMNRENVNQHFQPQRFIQACAKEG
tara:strand:+ start:674 stop:874 length:201 start_codon:yes stop_codon:yes gene_type:complete